MTYSSDPAVVGQKELKPSKWPNTAGLTLGTTKQYATSPFLKPRKITVLPSLKTGL